MSKKEEKNIKYLLKLADKTEDQELQKEILDRIEHLEKGKDEEYLDINKKDEGIFLGD